MIRFAVDTAFEQLSMALIENNTILARYHSADRRRNASILFQKLDELMVHAGIKPNTIDNFVINQGPGSYTGLRIGVAAAKGICFAQDIPLIGVNTLEIMVAPFFNKNEYDYLIPMLDARRMEVYSAIFDTKKRYIQKTNAFVLSENSFFDKVENGSCLVIGNGASKFKTLKPKINAHFNEEHFPSAIDMCGISWFHYKDGKFENLALFEPYYLKDFQTQNPKKK